MTEIPYFDRVSRGNKPLEPVGKIKGFLTAVYSQEVRDPNTGAIRHIHGLTREAYDKVATGYACGECLAEFGFPLIDCPACGMNLVDAASPQAQPQDWQRFFDERNNDSTPYTVPATIDDFMRSIGNDPDIEHVDLSDLVPSRAAGARRS